MLKRQKMRADTDIGRAMRHGLGLLQVKCSVSSGVVLVYAAMCSPGLGCEQRRDSLDACLP